MNDEYINYLFDFLVCIAKHAERFRNSVIIQTNGIHVGRGNTTVLGKRLEELYQVNPDVLVVIETSIKGTNPDEFALVARSPKSLFEYNLNSYYELLRLGIPNLRPTVIAGFGINESYLLNNGESKYRITMTRDGHTPIYHESQWSDEFRKLYEHFTNTYFALDPMFSRMPMYGLKDQFNYGWAIAALKRGRDIYAHNWYDAQYAGVRNLDIERAFVDMLGSFFLEHNQDYYSVLIRRA